MLLTFHALFPRTQSADQFHLYLLYACSNDDQQVYVKHFEQELLWQIRSKVKQSSRYSLYGNKMLFQAGIHKIKRTTWVFTIVSFIQIIILEYTKTKIHVCFRHIHEHVYEISPIFKYPISWPFSLFLSHQHTNVRK